MLAKNKWFFLFLILVTIWANFALKLKFQDKYGNDPNEYILIAINYLHPNNPKEKLKAYTNIYENVYSTYEKQWNGITNPHKKSINELWNKQRMIFFEIKMLFPFLAAKITHFVPSFSLIDSFLFITLTSMALCFLLLFIWTSKETNQKTAFVLCVFLLLFTYTFGFISILIYPDTLSAFFSLLFMFLIFYSYYPFLWGVVFFLAILSRQDNILLIPAGFLILLANKILVANKKFTNHDYLGIASIMIGFIAYSSLNFDLLTIEKYPHFKNLSYYFFHLFYTPFALVQSTMPFFILPLLVALPHIEKKYFALIFIAFFLFFIKTLLHPKFFERFYITTYLLIYMVSWVTLVNGIRVKKEIQ